MKAHGRFSVFLVSAALLGLPGYTSAVTIDEQRAEFRTAYEAAEHGKWSPDAATESALKEYVLWPDLRGKFLEKNLRLARKQEIDQFLAQHDGSGPARALRYRWAKYLHRKRQWDEFLTIYQQHYSTLGNTTLDCMAVDAQVAANATVNGALALDLWRVGDSQPEQCDPVFSWLSDSGILDTQQIRKRFQLALENRNISMATWLARRLGSADQQLVARWKALRDQPLKTLKRYQRASAGPRLREEIAYGMSRYARKDTEAASDLWQPLQKDFRFGPEAANQVAEEIALVAAWRHEPYAGKLIDRVDSRYRSDELVEWQIRTALRVQDWRGVLAGIALLSEDLGGSERWRYWHARALAKTGNPNKAEAILRQLATERSYHGFLAADQLGQDYAFEHVALMEQPETLEKLRQAPALIRARELYLTGLTGRARSEWDGYTKTLSKEDKAQAALLASNWQWHSRAIATAASGGHYDDLHLRYPLPWQASFAKSADRNEIATEWALGIARSESSFMHDVRSGAGAVGLMQLMPATGKATARAAKIPYRGRASLTDPKTNIQLGTRYLGDMYRRFGNSQVLATAAYNAGPHRVDAWLDDVDEMPAEIWIETIPFDETRKYVQRVLSANAVFHWRLTNRTQRITGALKPVTAKPRQVALAQAKNSPNG